MQWTCFAGALVVFVLLLFARHGPNPAEVDASAITESTTAISHGHLGQAVQATTIIPNPPGYPLLTAPLVVVLRPVVGAARWCSDKPLPPTLRGTGQAYFESIIGPCSGPWATSESRARPHWFHSQAVLGILAWIVLAAGAVALLRAGGAGRTWAEPLLVLLLALVPAASDAITQSFHPQDMASVGFACFGLASVMRGRIAGAGALFAVAFLCKQFALLPMIAAVVALPSWRGRARLLLPFAGVLAATLLPFEVANPSQFPHTLSGVYEIGAGIVHSPTLVGLLTIGEQLKLDLARDLPVGAALVLAVAARWRWRTHMGSPVALIGLALACLSLRLVFEVALLDYYFLAVAVFFLLLDLASRRLPVLSIGWIGLSRFALVPAATHLPTWLTALLFAGLAVSATVAGLAAVAASATEATAPDMRPPPGSRPITSGGITTQGSV